MNWISVKDRLPEKGQNVIMYRDIENTNIVFNQDKLEEDVIIGWYWEELDIFFSNTTNRTIQPTHWMPVPLKPTK